LWGLANLAGESATLRDKLLDKDILALSLNVYYRYKRTMKMDTKRTVAWMVNNLCRNKPAVQFHKVKDCLPYLQESLRESDTDILVENLWACAYLSDTGDQAAKSLIESEIMASVVSHLMSNIDSLAIVTPALRTCSNIVAGNDNVTERVINLGVVPSIMSLLNSQKAAIRREVCFFFSNVAAGTENQIAYIFQYPNFLSSLKKIIMQDEPAVVIEAIWVISNSVMGGGIDHVRKIIDSEIFEEIFKATPSLNNKGIAVVMDGFREILCNAMDMLDTPKRLPRLCELYRQEVERLISKKNDPVLEELNKDINDLMEDLEPYFENSQAQIDKKSSIKKSGYRED